MGGTTRDLPRFIRGLLLRLPAVRLIDRSGIFQAESYRHHYLAGNRLGDLPIVHYVLFGQRKGYRPNALFDPAHFEAACGTRSLARYLSDRRLWTVSTCREFDPAFYLPQVPVGRRNVPPLVDFWRIGLDEGLDPSSVFDTAFFTKATCRDVWDKRCFLFDEIISSSPAPFNARDLETRQRRFFDAIELTVLKEPPGQRRKNLVFVQASRAYEAKFLHEARPFDVLLNYYDGCSVPHPAADMSTAQAGTKVTAIRKLLDQRPDLLLAYDHVLFLDDDVAISRDAIQNLFAIMARLGLDLAQPSLTASSTTYFDDLKQPVAGDRVSALTAVEIMMPALSRRALEGCRWVFGTGISGWAVDFLLGKTVRQTFGTWPALVGSSIAAHLQPVDVNAGRFYRSLKVRGIVATMEAGSIALQHGLDDTKTAIRIIGAIE